MSPTLEDDLREALRRSTEHLEARPGLLADVRRGGARRRLRTRLAVAGAPLAVVAAVVAGSVVLPRLSGEADYRGDVPGVLSVADSAMFGRPTGGDLAADEAYLASVTALWRSDWDRLRSRSVLMLTGLTGQPVVVWAGRTPDGNAAVLAQRARARSRDGAMQSVDTLLVGYVGVDAQGRPRLVGGDTPNGGAPLPRTRGFFPAEGRGTVIVADLHDTSTVLLSTRRGYDTRGRVARTWTGVRFRDGVAVVAVPAGLAEDQVALEARGLPTGSERSYPAATGLDGGSTSAGPYDSVDWSQAGGFPVVGDPPADWTGQSAADLFAGHVQEPSNGFLEPMLGDTLSVVGFGTTARGTPFAVGEVATGSDPLRLVVLLRLSPGRVDSAGSLARPGATLPYKVHLPDGEGWLVGRPGAELSYRAPGTGWIPAGRHAAALPDRATTVLVEQPGRPPESEPLD